MKKKCPSCNTSLEGELIYQTFLKQYKDPKKALELAQMYGATETEGRWNKAEGEYDLIEDRTVSYSCPFCKFKWKR